jgi:hypothetical protein
MQKITKKQQLEIEQKEAKEEVLKLVKKGNYKVYTALKHVSSSGMFRLIDCFVIIKNKPQNINWYIEKLGLFKRNDDGRLKVSGCGMDMGFCVVYNLSSVIFRNSFICRGDSDKYAERCPSNDHVNGDRNYKPHLHSDGGYALKQVWI